MSMQLTAFMVVFFVAIIGFAAGISWIAISDDVHSPVRSQADGE